MKIQPLITKAGKYDVQFVARPHTNQPIDLNAAPAGILHTEEGSFDGSERIFSVHYSPHFVVGIHQGKPTIWQHVPVGLIGLACRAHNNQALVEIELEGSAKEESWLPDPVRLDLLSSLMLACRDTWGIPLTRPWADGDYGRASDNPHRHAGKLGKVAGWYAHADMPQPDTHWDPGNLRWADVFARAEAIGHELAAPAPAVPKPAPKPAKGGR